MGISTRFCGFKATGVLKTDHAQGKEKGQNSEEGCQEWGREEKDARKETENEFSKGRKKTSPENTEVKGEKCFILSTG